MKSTKLTKSTKIKLFVTFVFFVDNNCFILPIP